MSKKTNRPVLQHYVPQFLLKNFCESKKRLVWVFDKQTGQKFQSNIKNIASEKGLYDYEAEGKTRSIEPALSELETETAHIMKSIRKTESIANLTEDQRYALSLFFSVQFFRTRYHADQVYEFACGFDQVVRRFGANPEDMPGYAPPDREGARLGMLESIGEAHKFIPLFLSKSWLLAKTSSRRPLQISDNPLVLQNSLNRGGPLGNIGLAVKGIEIYLPLTPELVLGMFCPSIEIRFREGSRTYAQISRLVPAIRERPDLDFSRIDKLLSALDGGSAVTLDADNVTNLNSLQVIFARRFVFSCTNDFSFAERMIRDHPKYRTGPKPVWS